MAQELNKKIAESYANLLESYFNKINGLTESYKKRVRAEFSGADNQTKRSMLDGLEYLIDDVEVVLSGEPPKRFSLIFDPQRAVQVRKARGLTQQQLGEIIGGIRAEIISRYESGQRYPVPKRIGAKNYLNWLMLNGDFSERLQNKK